VHARMIGLARYVRVKVGGYYEVTAKWQREATLYRVTLSHYPFRAPPVAKAGVGYSLANVHRFRQIASMSTNLLNRQQYLSLIPLPRKTPRDLTCISQNDDAKIAKDKPIPA